MTIMKENILRRAIEVIVHVDFLWLFLRPIAKFGAMLVTYRNRKENKLALTDEKRHFDEIFAAVIASKTVLHGPFEGLRYPSLDAAGSSLYPKLVGSYELEIQPIIEDICLHSYDTVINIGCGEGYYAVGLALRLKSANIFAFDTDQEAQRMTYRMAELNSVSDRVSIGSMFTSSDFEKFVKTGHTLIFCDCEGYEIELFTRRAMTYLRFTTLLVEVHDFIDIGTSTALIELFSSTHEVTTIKSNDDLHKARDYDFEEAKRYSMQERKKLFGEGRPSIMEWLYARPKI